MAERHPPAARLLKNEQAEVQGVRYSDRYLFTPLSVALLIELINGLRAAVTPYRWNDPAVVIVTTDARAEGTAKFSNTVWSDWRDMDERNRTLVAAFEYAGIDTDLQAVAKSRTPHARTLVVEFSTGSTLTLRLDQGVSYWRAARSGSEQKHLAWFNFGLDDPEQQGQMLAELHLPIEGAMHPTELFAKVRQKH